MQFSALPCDLARQRLSGSTTQERKDFRNPDTSRDGHFGKKSNDIKLRCVTHCHYLFIGPLTENCLHFFVTTLSRGMTHDHATSLKPSLGTLDPGLKMRKHLSQKKFQLCSAMGAITLDEIGN
jgi:hypothetical protein